MVQKIIAIDKKRLAVTVAASLSRGAKYTYKIALIYHELFMCHQKATLMLSIRILK